MNGSARINLSSGSFLVVDDNPQAIELMYGVLDSFGMRKFKRAISADEAKEACGDSVFDLILTDAQMPGVDGYEFIRWLRRSADEQARLTPAIIVTAHTRRSQVTKARDCGANHHRQANHAQDHPRANRLSRPVDAHVHRDRELHRTRSPFPEGGTPRRIRDWTTQGRRRGRGSG